MASNTCIGLSLATVNAGNAIPIQTNTAGFIGSNQFYTQIATCPTTSNNISLPTNPILGQTYTIRNDGASVCFLSAGSTTSTINGISSANGAEGTFMINANGGNCSFIAVSTNGAANTALTSAAPNNPLVVWHTITPPPQEQNAFTVLTGMTTASAGSAVSATNFELVSGCVYTVPAMGGACAVTLPANAANCNVSYTFRMVGTVGNAMTFTAATATTIKGVYNLSGGTVIKAAATTAVITATALAGDVFTITGDGTYWYVTGIGSAAASFS